MSNMRGTRIKSLLILLAILLLVVAFWAYRLRAPLFFHPSSTMILMSSAFAMGGRIPEIYTCEGKNINPPLQISDVPGGTKSLALIMDDPDIPEVAKDTYHIDEWIHWVVWNIPATTNKIDTNMPIGTTGMSTRWVNAYGWPCPPDREHRYFFRLYALDTLLELPKETSKKELLLAMKWHVLATAELMGTYIKHLGQ